MAFATVSHILTNPETYLGKKIKVRGSYTSSYNEEESKQYHSMVIEDMGCCTQNFAFKRENNSSSPEEYPEENTLIEAVGIFAKCEEAGYDFYYLSVSTLTPL